MLPFCVLFQAGHDKGVPDVSGTFRHQLLVHIVAMLFCKEGQHHNDCSGVSFTERMDLPKPWKALRKVVDKGVPRKILPLE